MQQSKQPDEPVEFLVRRAQVGDAGAFDRLVHACYRKIYRWALGHTGDPDDADDVTQEVLVLLHRKLTSYKGRSSFSTWLFQITRNAALGLHRRRVRRTRMSTLLLEEANREVTQSADQLDKMEMSQTSDLIGRLFGSLPERQRQVFDLADMQGYAPAEIGEMLGMKAVTVRANLCKARRAIRTKILESCPEIVEGLAR